MFSDGFANRVIVDGHGVLVTTDALDVGAFEEFAVALRRQLADHDPA